VYLSIDKSIGGGEDVGGVFQYICCLYGPNSGPYVQTGGDFGKLDFQTVAAGVTPLPPAWTMMLIGIAGFGFVAYRRRSNPTLMPA
jgi:hypothetical protein